MTIDEITARICAFRDARDWMQFHNPKDLAVAISAEAGELVSYLIERGFMIDAYWDTVGYPAGFLWARRL